MRLLSLLVVCSEVMRVAGVVTTSNRSPTTLAVSKRAPFVTRFSTIFFSGDPSQIRTAEIGFDARVDVDRSLWGFCPTSVFVASDCGLAGNCIDRHACPRGCGKGGGLTTFTCTGSSGEFCTTAELYLSGGIGPFSYIGCGGGPTTDRYSAFTTTPTSATTTATPSSRTPTSSSTPPLTTAQASESRANSTALSVPTSAAGAESASAGTTPNNTAAIIGGVIGCVALLCGSGIVITWLLRRQRSKNNLAVKPSSNLEPAPQYDENVDGGWQEVKTMVVKPELESREMYSWKREGSEGAAELPGGWTPNGRS
ncbi:hypothetical protein B0T16DRAFT_415061 [Cercophora newfieldiana]|uniref:Uncharacterized protein n=1 Tax=Cercophora newfieldiana TaxID=92897 RepID=A0AA40CLK8_9PEZI|nr:hypothetical protein B0T16DRAFT_415061 [Cercophora newfieldiana]